MLPRVDPDEKRQAKVLRHLVSWWRVVMSKTVPHFLRVGLRLDTFCRKECLGRGVYWLSLQALRDLIKWRSVLRLGDLVLYLWRAMGRCPYGTDGHKHIESYGPGAQGPGAWQTKHLPFPAGLSPECSLGFQALAQPETRLPFTVLQKESQADLRLYMNSTASDG